MRKSWMNENAADVVRLARLGGAEQAAAIRQLKLLLAYYPSPRTTREFRGDFAAVQYRLPSGGKTSRFATALEKWSKYGE